MEPECTGDSCSITGELPPKQQPTTPKFVRGSLVKWDQCPHCAEAERRLGPLIEKGEVTTVEFDDAPPDVQQDTGGRVPTLYLQDDKGEVKKCGFLRDGSLACQKTPVDPWTKDPMDGDGK